MKKIVFVYNAKSGLWNKVFDGAHKIISPSTYSCTLCKITHGNFNEHQLWKGFRKNTDVPFVFMYKDEFLNKYSRKIDDQDIQFPVVLEKTNDVFKIILNRQEIESMVSLEELITSIKKLLRIKS